MQLPVAADVELGGPRARNLLRPLADGGPPYAKNAGDLDLRPAVESNHFTFEHGRQRYRMGNREVNYGKPGFAGQLRVMDEREETRGQRIKRMREARNLTQPALAQLLIAKGAPSTLTKAAIHKWESGDTKNMQNDTFILLCGALGVDPPYLLWGPDRRPPENRPAASPRVIKRKS